MIELDRGNNDHIDEWYISGCGVLKEEERTRLLEVMEAEKKRLAMTEEKRKAYDAKKAEEAKVRAEEEKRLHKEEKIRRQAEAEALTSFLYAQGLPESDIRAEGEHHFVFFAG